MRRSHKTNALVLISDHTKAIYDDRWGDEVFLYTGMGLRGDQSLEFSQNKTLYQSYRSQSSDVELYLFQVFKPKEYTCIGQVRVAKEPYLERQLDNTKIASNVWIFPLKLLHDDEPRNLLPREILEDYQELKERRARKLSDKELQERIRFQKSTPEIRETATKTFIRDSNVAEYAKRRARGVCQLCGNPAPFHDRTGAPFLEVHYVKWLSTGGSDVTDNVVALCPNCHRKMHVLNLRSDQDALGSFRSTRR